MTGDDFLLLADSMLRAAPAPSEAVCRTAISRAYYGAYHLAIDFLRTLKVTVGKDHGDVWKRLGATQVPLAKQVATRLAMLHDNRTLADYRLDAPQPKSVAFARDSIDRGLYIQRLLKSCQQEPALSQIKLALGPKGNP